MPVTFEAAENEPIFSDAVGVGDQLGFQSGQVDVPVGVLGNGDHIGNRLAPRDLVGMVLERPDEDDRALIGGDVLREVVAVVEIGREPKVHDADQLVDCAGRPGPAEDHAGFLVATDGIANDPASILTQSGRLQSGARRLGVGVGVTGKDLVADEVLDEAQRPPRGGVVGVGDAMWPVWAVHHLIVADDGFADALQQRGLGRVDHRCQAIWCCIREAGRMRRGAITCVAALTLSACAATSHRSVAPATAPASSAPATTERRIDESTAQQEPTSTSVPWAGPCGRQGAGPQTYDHVIWIWMENKNQSAVFDSSRAPFMARLAASCGAAGNYTDHGIHPSLPNYIAATSGDTQGVDDDAGPGAHPLGVDNIFHQVRAMGKVSKSYQEGMPANCALKSTSHYAVKHNPAAYYLGHDDRDACLRDDVAFDQFFPDLAQRLARLLPHHPRHM